MQRNESVYVCHVETQELFLSQGRKTDDGCWVRWQHIPFVIHLIIISTLSSPECTDTLHLGLQGPIFSSPLICIFSLSLYSFLLSLYPLPSSSSHNSLLPSYFLIYQHSFIPISYVFTFLCFLLGRISLQLSFFLLAWTSPKLYLVIFTRLPWHFHASGSGGNSLCWRKRVKKVTIIKCFITMPTFYYNNDTIILLCFKT